jgi:hypothetical protein
MTAPQCPERFLQQTSLQSGIEIERKLQQP